MAARTTPLLLLGTILVVGIYLLVQNLENLTYTEVELGLPVPIVDMNFANSLNSYQPQSLLTKGPSLTVVVRTYNAFIKRQATDKLLENFKEQVFTDEVTSSSSDSSETPAVSLLMVATDEDSVASVRKWGNEHKQQSHGTLPASVNVDVHYHDVPSQVYLDNCCQIDAMCSGPFHPNWLQAGKKYYSNYTNGTFR